MTLNLETVPVGRCGKEPHTAGGTETVERVNRGSDGGRL